MRSGRYNAPVIPGLILASGRSTRMGRSKALLRAGAPGLTFVRRIAGTLLEGGVQDVLVVGRPDDEPLRTEVDRIGGRIRFVENANSALGQLSSVIAGLDAIEHPGVRGVLITPVDFPLVRAETIARIIDAFGRTHARVVRPVYGGRHGHPVLFSRALFDALRHADPESGARTVVHAWAQDVRDVDVDDAGVVEDVDSPEDYARVFGRDLES